MTMPAGSYAARLQVDYPEQLDRVTTLLRVFWLIPIAILVTILTASGDQYGQSSTGEWVQTSGGGIGAGLAVATALMILFRQRYPRWWFDFALELARFEGRIGAYAGLLTDQYPSTEDEQSVHLELDYPDAANDLNRWLPLVKWLLAIPHYIVLFFLVIGVLFSVIFAWFAILFTGRYPEGLFKFVVGVGRWALRVQAYAFLMLTDTYPPFSLD